MLLLIFSVKGDGRCDGRRGKRKNGKRNKEEEGRKRVNHVPPRQIVFNMNKTCLTQDVYLRYMFEVKTNDLCETTP